MKTLISVGTSLLLLSTAAVMAARPTLKTPFELALGKQLFEKNCASCHGELANGTDQGPPLVHRFYLPNHHADEAFYRAALNGVRAHHWNYGNMPPVPGISKRKLDRIVPYIRWLQKQQGQGGMLK